VFVAFTIVLACSSSLATDLAAHLSHGAAAMYL
jgi:hypothetical protein